MAERDLAGLSDATWRSHDQAIAGVVRALTDYYLGSTPNRATPAKFRAVLVWLDYVTRPVADYFDARPLAETQEALDFRAWRQRLDAYKAASDQALAIDPENRAAADHTTRVVAPLLLGWYPGAAEQRSPDVVTPLSLGFQVKVRTGTYAQAWRQLQSDLKTGTAGVAATIGAAIVAAGAIAAGAIIVSKVSER